MGDRCQMQVTCRAEDKAQFEELGFLEVGECELGLRMEDEQANYAHDGEMPTGIPYLGSYSPGGDYSAGDFACDGDRLLEVSTLGDGPVATVDATGAIDKGDREHILAYYQVLAVAEQRLKDAMPK